MDNISNKLKKLLFDTRSEYYAVIKNKKAMNVYALLDSAKNNDIYDYIDIYEPEHRCLYWGILQEKLFSVAPYIVKLTVGEDFTEWMLENCYGNSQVMFLLSHNDIDSILEHLKPYVIIDIDQDKLDYDDAEIGDYTQKHDKALFAFYDPRVFYKWRTRLTKEAADEFCAEFEMLVSENPENIDEITGYKPGTDRWHEININLKQEKIQEEVND